MSGEKLSLHELVAEMADRLAGVDTGEVWGNFSCAEIESIADVLRAAGHEEVATFIVEEHAMSDNEDDEHGGAE